VNDLEHPYSTEGDYFLWIRGQQLGGRLHSYGRMLLRSSDHEFKAASYDGLGADWPISYADLEPYYARIEEFFGIYGTSEGLETCPTASTSARRGCRRLRRSSRRRSSAGARGWAGTQPVRSSTSTTSPGTYRTCSSPTPAVTCRPAAVGPTLTIMALTARACEHVAREHAGGRL